VLEGAFEKSTARIRGVLIDGRDELLAYREMATLQDAGVKRPPDSPTDWRGASKAAAEAGMNRLSERLAELGK
jgi:hypothetical protein